MESNLPPGMTDRMIPGNTPEDEEWESLFNDMATWGLSPAEIRRRVLSTFWKRRRQERP